MRKRIKFTAKEWNSRVLLIDYGRASLEFRVEDLSEENQKLLTDYPAGEYNISGFGWWSKFEIDPQSLVLNFNQTGIPILLHKHTFPPIQYIRYHYYEWGINRHVDVQFNGFMVYCAPTGGGKTYFAINNLEPMSKQVDTILYINLELSVDDIYNRIKKQIGDIPKNLYVCPLNDITAIIKWAEDKGKCLFIVDNIDNLISGSDNAYGVQLDFINDLDRFLKTYHHHALVLTQLTKDNNRQLFDKTGDISGAINTNILSGVKQLSYLSRSVMMTAFSEDKDSYVYKILKVGSAIYEQL